MSPKTLVSAPFCCQQFWPLLTHKLFSWVPLQRNETGTKSRALILFKNFGWVSHEAIAVSLSWREVVFSEFQSIWDKSPCREGPRHAAAAGSYSSHRSFLVTSLLTCYSVTQKCSMNANNYARLGIAHTDARFHKTHNLAAAVVA